MILGYIVTLKVKKKEICNLSKVILSNFNFFIHCFGCNFNSAKKKKEKKILNEIIIISNTEVLNYRHRDSTNGKKHKLHDKQGQTKEGPVRQRKHQYR